MVEFSVPTPRPGTFLGERASSRLPSVGRCVWGLHAACGLLVLTNLRQTGGVTLPEAGLLAREREDLLTSVFVAKSGGSWGHEDLKSPAGLARSTTATHLRAET